MAAGIKRGLMGGVTGNYIWVFVPIYGTSSAGNAIALEAVSISNGDKISDPNGDFTISGAAGATYFFRLVRRQQYSKLGLNDLDNKCDESISHLNELMLDLNFRREPIYLSERAS
jgi:hypothetical protein